MAKSLKFMGVKDEWVFWYLTVHPDHPLTWWAFASASWVAGSGLRVTTVLWYAVMASTAVDMVADAVVAVNWGGLRDRRLQLPSKIRTKARMGMARLLAS